MIFDPITPADHQRFKPFFKHQPYDLCSYSLLSIIVWQNDAYRPLAAITDDALIISTDFTRDPEKRYLLLPVSAQKEYPPRTLHDLAQSAGCKRYWFVPDSYIKKYGDATIRSYFTIEPQPEYDDYIYRRKDLANLRGNRFSKKRNLIKQFEREYVNSNRARIEKVTAGSADECVEFIEAWCQERECEADAQSEMACEKQAVLNAIWNLDALETNGLLLRIDGKVCAFGIGAYLTDDMGVLHFEKAFTKMKGLYQYFDKECARRLFTTETFINKESDMGEPNLARAKKSYHPIRMIQSYQLTLRD